MLPMLGYFAMATTLSPTTVAADTIRVLDTTICPGRINPMQCGQFMEYLCDLIPGMWAERLYDGSFEGLSPYKFTFRAAKDFKEEPWYPSGAINRLDWGPVKERPISGEKCEKLTIRPGAPATAGISQDGIFAEKGKKVRFSAYLREDGFDGPVTISIRGGGKLIASAELHPGATWKKLSAEMTPSATFADATFSIQFRGPGTLWLDSASLMPLDTVGGWRRDVVQALRALKPGVIRIGGSVVEEPSYGDFQWTDTIGDPDRRKPFRAWGGLQPTGPGLEEFVALCRKVGAEPMICVRTQSRTPQDAADQVEYFNGAATTKWGALRAKNGHRAPYKIKFWQVGNERAGDVYEKALAEFCKAMKGADPSIRLFSSYPTENVLKLAGKYLDYVCPHHYGCDNLEWCQSDLDNIRKMLKEWEGTRGQGDLGTNGAAGLQPASSGLGGPLRLGVLARGPGRTTGSIGSEISHKAAKSQSNAKGIEGQTLSSVPLSPRPPVPSPRIKVAVTEWNTTAGDWELGRARLWTLENALAVARYHNLMHRNADLVTISNRSNLTNSFCSGIIQTDNHRLYKTPAYYAQWMYANLQGQIPLKIEPPAPLKAGLDVSATLSGDGKTLTLFVVNDSLDEVRKTFDLSAFGKLGKEVQVWTLADRDKAGEPDVTNEFGDPERIATSKKTIAVRSAKLETSLPPLSLTVFVMSLEGS